jgi:membrane protease YdiL (CAAX protease family)
VDNLAVEAPSSAETALLKEEQGPPQLGAKRAFTIFVTFYVVQILLAILAALPVGVAASIRATTSGETSAASYEATESQAIVFGSLVGTLFAGFVVLRMARRTLPGSIASGALSSIGWSRASASQLTSAAALGATIALFYLIVLVRLFPPAPDHALGPFSGAIRSGGWPLHVWALLVLVSAPIEEFVHRGVLFSGFSRSWGTLWSGLFATVVFVLAHVFEVRPYWPALLSVTLAATAFIMLRIKMQSFIPAVVCHAAYNAVIVVATYGGRPNQ